MRMSDLTARPIHGDVSGNGFAIRWAEIPWHYRIALMVGAPLFGAMLYLFGSRERFSHGYTVDSPSVRDRYPTDDSQTTLDDVVLHERDRHLVKRIESHLVAEGDRPLTTAILFGAAICPPSQAVDGRHEYRVRVPPGSR